MQFAAVTYYTFILAKKDLNEKKNPGQILKQNILINKIKREKIYSNHNFFNSIKIDEKN